MHFRKKNLFTDPECCFYFFIILLNLKSFSVIYIDTITTDDVRILRLFHLLFRVACPVVRMTFNKEIPPIQLREKLDKCKKDLEDHYRKTDAIINNIQWDLLYKQGRGI